MRINPWENRIRMMMSRMSPSKSQRKFMAGVWELIEQNPDVYPTFAQTRILSNIWRHCQRLKAEEHAMQMLEHSDKV